MLSRMPTASRSPYWSKGPPAAVRAPIKLHSLDWGIKLEHKYIFCRPRRQDPSPSSKPTLKSFLGPVLKYHVNCDFLLAPQLSAWAMPPQPRDSTRARSGTRSRLSEVWPVAIRKMDVRRRRWLRERIKIQASLRSDLRNRHRQRSANDLLPWMVFLQDT